MKQQHKMFDIPLGNGEKPLIEYVTRKRDAKEPIEGQIRMEDF